MRKGLAIQALVFMLLCLFLYGHAQDRSEADKSANSQKASENTPSAEPQKSNPAALPQQTSIQRPSNEPKSVRIILPPKDKYDLIAFGAGIVVAVVGVFGVSCSPPISPLAVRVLP